MQAVLAQMEVMPRTASDVQRDERGFRKRSCEFRGAGPIQTSSKTPVGVPVAGDAPAVLRAQSAAIVPSVSACRTVAPRAIRPGPFAA